MALSDINFDINEAGSWPAPIKAIVVIILMAVVGFLGYWFDIKDLWVKYESTQEVELQLKDEFTEKQKVVANIEEYRVRLEQLSTMLAEVVKQLPTRTQMPDLLEEVSNTGIANGLEFELFRPGNEIPGEFYAVVPIQIRATASYHQFGAFVSTISALPRIVTLNRANLTEVTSTGGRRGGSTRMIAQAGDVKNDQLRIEATLQTFRYLEESEQN